MATAGSWTTHYLIQKWFIWLNLHTLQTILLDEVDKNHIYSLLLAVMIILITHVFLKGCCIIIIPLWDLFRLSIINVILTGNAFTMSTC